MAENDNVINKTKYMTVEELAECAEISKQSGPQIMSTDVDEKHQESLIPDDKLDEFFKGDGTVPAETEVSAASPEIKNLPASVDLRKWTVKVDDQGSEGTCTAFASVDILALKIAKETGKKYDLSEYHHWYNYAEYNSWSAANALCRFWQGEERYWPNHARQGLAGWDESRMATLAAPRILNSLAEVKAHLASGEPVLLSVGLDTRYWTSPIVYGDRGEQRSGHAINLVGYITDDRLPVHQKTLYIVKNSWGENYGDRGYNYLTEDYFTNNRFWTQFIAFDKQVIWRPGKKPGGDNNVTSIDLQAVAYPMFKYGADTGQEHTAYAVTLKGKDEGKVKSVSYTNNSELGVWADKFLNPNFIGTYAQSGYLLTTAEVTLEDGQKVKLEAKVP